MKLLALIYGLCLCVETAVFSRTCGDTLVAVFWNLENFFDYTDEGNGDSDRDFSPEGDRRWTKGRYWKKCHAVAKCILWMSDRYGKVPDVIGVAEVENGRVVHSVAEGTLLRKYGYEQVHEDSPDRRGIDVALMYRSDVFSLAGMKAFAVRSDADGNAMNTRDILYVLLEDGSGGRYHFLVNHHPSKYGGVEVSDGRRTAVMKRMLSVCDSLRSEGEENIVCMGDFNDTPDGRAMSMAEPSLCNLAAPLHRKGLGTIRFGGRWELIDMFLVSPGLAEKSYMDICFPDFLKVKDGRHSGMKPLRTYTGPRYTGGVSDHLPIVLIVKKD